MKQFLNWLKLLGDVGATTYKSNSLLQTAQTGVTTLNPITTPGVFVDSRQLSGKMRAYPFWYTFVTGVVAAPTISLTYIDQGTRYWGTVLWTDGLSISAGVNCTFSIGDSGSATRFGSALDTDLTNATSAPFFICPLAAIGYEFTAVTEIIGTIAASKTPVVGKSIWGYLICDTGH